MQEAGQYTVWSRGRNLGHTELGFRRTVPGARVGWFHPTAAGERVMPLVSAVPVALRAIARRGWLRDVDDDPPAVIPEEQVTLLADLAEAMQHLQSLELELRRPDGSLVPVTNIGLQDMEVLLQLTRPEMFESMDDAEWECDDGDFSSAVYDPDDPECAGDLRELEDLDNLDGVEDLMFAGGWEIDDSPVFGRYQIVVQLEDDGVIP